MEFVAYMQLFNLDFDPILGNVLQTIADTTEITILNIDTGRMYSDLNHSIAGIYKGSLTKHGFEPYILQNTSYIGILLMVIYLAHFIMILAKFKPIRWMEMLRYSLFNILFIDYLGYVYRTLGHHPSRTKEDGASKLSFYLAIYMFFCFQYELYNLTIMTNTLYKINESEKTPIQKAFT
jgi:hypothetical protein